jgi:hypothetical protein
MSDPLLSSLLRALGLVVIERLPNSTYHLLTPAPDWLSTAFDETPSGAQGTLGGTFPFLDHFLQQADAAWHDGPSASAESGPFSASVGGEDLLLRATAMTVEQRKLLVVERLTGDADSRPILQKAREHLLEREQLVRQIVRIHAPAAAIHDGLQRLQDLSLTTEQRAIVERVLQASRDVQSAMASLPAAPRLQRRQVRPG